MKKLLFLVMAVIATVFTSCARLDSKKVSPNIIGTAYLQYDSTNNLCYTVIDSTEYHVSKVLIPGNKGYGAIRTSQIMYVDEVYVTLFTSPHLKGVQAVVGKQTEAQIRQMCQKSIETEVFILFVVIFIVLIVGFALYETQIRDKRDHGKKP